jgi:lambda repressor-like predicted transcriptional regulator
MLMAQQCALLHTTSSAFLQQFPVARLCKNDRMSEAATRARAQILGYLDETGWSATRLARMAGVRPSTLTRFLNLPTFKSVPNTTTLVKLETAVIAWRAERDSAQQGTAPASAEQRGRFVHEPDQIAWLDLWNSIPPPDRRRAVMVLRALALDPSKFG